MSLAKSRVPKVQEKKKILIGVKHIPEELDKLKRRLEVLNPASVGLELREDYEDAKEYLSVGFFGDLYSYLYAKKIKTLLLESVDLWNQYKETEIIKAVFEGSMTIEKIKQELFDVEEQLGKLCMYSSPEVIIPFVYTQKRLSGAVKLFSELSKEAILQRWGNLNKNRSDYFVRRILETPPDTVIVGLGHAMQMIGSLTEFSLENFSGEIPIGIPLTTMWNIQQ